MAADDSKLSPPASPKMPSEVGTISYFLMKSEPDVFSIDDLEAKCVEPWDGVRSHQAKKVIQSMKIGDEALFYHSNAKPPGIVGIATIVKESYPDPAQFDPKSKYYDAKSTKNNAKWYAVDVQFQRKFNRMVSLDELKKHKDEEQLKDMALFKYGRLSVQPVTLEEWEYILQLATTTVAE